MKVLTIAKRLCALGLLLAMLAALSGCAGRETKTEPLGKAYFSYFDTVSYVYSYAGDSAERFDNRSAEVSHILEKYHKLFDIYHEYEGMNNLCTLNRLAGGEPLEVDGELLEFLLLCRQLYELTGGEMNVMLGAVLRPWHEAREAAAEDPEHAAAPSEETLREAAEHTDIALLELDEAAGTARIADPEASIDVGAVGKGYATEKAAQWLEADGAEGYVLNIGGNIRIIGLKPDGSSWNTAIRDPYDDGAYALHLRLEDTACVTSGIYERYFVADGVRYHHIIDPDTLAPAAYFGSLTVVCKDSGLADALSTALFCLPYEEGLKLVDSLEGVEALWIFPDGEQRWSSGLGERILDS